MPMLNRRRFIISAAMIPFTGRALAEDWPSRPVKIVYPYAAGSAGDVAARLVVQRLGETFGHAFIIENRTGANGMLAAEAAAHATADGYTLFWGTTPQIAISPALTKAPYDPVKDFIPISAAVTNTFVLVVNAKFPAKTLIEFVDYVRARPNKLNYAEGGIGSLNHLAMAMFLKRANLTMANVTYKGNAPALNDVVAGNVPAMFSLLGDALPHAASGAIRMLAVSSRQHCSQVPDVPTVDESGYPGYVAISWNGLLAPAGTPQLIVDRVASEVARAVKDPALARRLIDLGVEPLGDSPAEFAAMVASDIALWGEAIRISGAVVAAE
jgi:tripartite-type tricarboxylate transporter receptor subunit TctC